MKHIEVEQINVRLFCFNVTIVTVIKMEFSQL